MDFNRLISITYERLVNTSRTYLRKIIRYILTKYFFSRVHVDGESNYEFDQ